MWLPADRRPLLSHSDLSSVVFLDEYTLAMSIPFIGWADLTPVMCNERQSFHGLMILCLLKVLIARTEAGEETSMTFNP